MGFLGALGIMVLGCVATSLRAAAAVMVLGTAITAVDSVTQSIKSIKEIKVVHEHKSETDQ